LAKSHGLRANAKSNVLVNQLSEIFRSSQISSDGALPLSPIKIPTTRRTSLAHSGGGNPRPRLNKKVLDTIDESANGHLPPSYFGRIVKINPDSPGVLVLPSPFAKRTNSNMIKLFQSRPPTLPEPPKVPTAFINPPTPIRYFNRRRLQTAHYPSPIHYGRCDWDKEKTRRLHNQKGMIGSDVI